MTNQNHFRRADQKATFKVGTILLIMWSPHSTKTGNFSILLARVKSWVAFLLIIFCLLTFLSLQDTRVVSYACIFKANAFWLRIYWYIDTVNWMLLKAFRKQICSFSPALNRPPCTLQKVSSMLANTVYHCRTQNQTSLLQLP